MTNITISSARESIYQHFVDNFSATYQALWSQIQDDDGLLVLDDDNQPILADGSVANAEYIFENEKIDPSSLQDSSWMRLGVRNTVSTQESMGQPLNREFLRKGYIFAQIFTPINKGMQQSDFISEALRVLFEGKTIGGIRIYTCNVNEGLEDPPWKQTNVQIAFDYNQTK